VTIVREGYPFVLIPLILSVVLFLVGGSVFVFMGWVSFIVSLFCLYFFRDPTVTVTTGNDLILSPCNGTVLETAENEKENVIRVFLSVFDVHLQRSPVSGTVIDVCHKPGKFLNAMNDRAHIENEQNIITIKNENGIFIVKQIAGFVARRCVSWVKEGDILEAGDKIGVIKFSSQVDLHVPKNVHIKVSRGDRVVSGVTVFAKISSK
jgi:phosphatidylserine decarboxylase